MVDRKSMTIIIIETHFRNAIIDLLCLTACKDISIQIKSLPQQKTIQIFKVEHTCSPPCLVDNYSSNSKVPSSIPPK